MEKLLLSFLLLLFATLSVFLLTVYHICVHYCKHRKRVFRFQQITHNIIIKMFKSVTFHYVCHTCVLHCTGYVVSQPRSKKRRRRKKPKRKSTKQQKQQFSHITKHFKVPNEWFKVPPMVNQSTRWSREKRTRRYITEDTDNERPKWLLNLNEHRDIDDERPLWLLNINKENIPKSRKHRRFQQKQESREHRSFQKQQSNSRIRNWCYVAGCRRRLSPNGPKWRRYAYEYDMSITCIMSSTIDSLQPEHEFGFHERRILARLKSQVTSARLKQIYHNDMINWSLSMFQFNSTLGYPGEGPSRGYTCNTCKQWFRSKVKAEACKCKRWCTECHTKVKSLQKHMTKEHKGWLCPHCKGRLTTKQKRDECTCQQCPVCFEHKPQLTNHLEKNHKEAFKEYQRKRSQGNRRNQTQEQRKKKNQRRTERKKLDREAANSHVKKHKCPKCEEPFRYLCHAERCACKRCNICVDETWSRDLQQHNLEKHPAQYVKQKTKIDVYKKLRKLRKQCLTGVKELRTELQRVFADGDKTPVSFYESCGCSMKKAESLNVRVAAEIVGRDVHDPLLEGLDTWNGELYEKMGQQCRAVDPKTGAFTSGYIPGTEDNVPLYQDRMMRIRDQEYRRFQMRTCDTCCDTCCDAGGVTRTSINPRYPNNISNHSTRTTCTLTNNNEMSCKRSSTYWIRSVVDRHTNSVLELSKLHIEFNSQVKQHTDAASAAT